MEKPMWLLRGIGLLSLCGAIWVGRGTRIDEWWVWSVLLGGALLLWGLHRWQRKHARIALVFTVLADYALAGALVWASGGAGWAYWLLVLPLGGALWQAGATGAFISAPIGAGTVVVTSFALTGNFLPTDAIALSWAVGLIAVSLALGWAWGHRAPAALHAMLEQATRALEHGEVVQRELRHRYHALMSDYCRLEECLTALQDVAELWHALRETHAPEAAYRALLERLQARVGAAGVALLLPDLSGKVLRTTSAVGMLAPLQHAALTTPLHASTPQDLSPHLVQQALLQALRSESLDFAQSTSLEDNRILVCPLQQSERTIGVLVLVAPANQGFEAAQCTRVHKLAPYLVDIVSLLEQLRVISNRLAETQLLYDLESLLFHSETVPALCQRALTLIKTVLPFEQAQLLLRQGDTLQVAAQVGTMPNLDRLSLESLPKQAQIVRYDREGVPAGMLMLAPLRSSERTEGMLVLGRTKLPPFSETELELFQTLALQVANVLDRAQLLSDLERLAFTDGLTGLCNYRHFQMRYREEINRCRRYQQPMAIMLIDLDGFKQVNDQYGHLEGDYLLVQLAEVLQHSLRNTELIARYGGDEFVVLMPSTNLQGALAAARRVLEAVRETQFLNTSGQLRLQVSVSIGVAAYPDSTTNPAEVLEKADAALELAKRSGRNQAVALENSA
ncbi:MAG: diguanylate cyclase [Armatimonadota bacterium]|nr:diguanylate cyclase [Armatimonadota bacterium]